MHSDVQSPKSHTVHIQGKAGLVDRAFLTYQEMLAKGHEASTHSVNILLDACARANQPARGQEFFDTEIPLRNIELSHTEWNSLLSLYNAAGDMVCAICKEPDSTACMLQHCISLLYYSSPMLGWLRVAIMYLAC